MGARSGVGKVSRGLMVLVNDTPLLRGLNGINAAKQRSIDAGIKSHPAILETFATCRKHPKFSPVVPEKLHLSPSLIWSFTGTHALTGTMDEK